MMAVASERDPLAAMLTAWRAEIDSVDVPELARVAAAVAVVTAGQPVSGLQQ